jgi:hypothetical protein
MKLRGEIEAAAVECEADASEIKELDERQSAYVCDGGRGEATTRTPNVDDMNWKSEIRGLVADLLNSVQAISRISRKWRKQIEE